MAITYNDQWNDIVNRALALLGRETLANYETDESADAGLARSFLSEAVSVCAEYFDWTFLRECTALSQDSHTSGPYNYAYTLPSDLSRLSGVDTEGAGFEILSGRIHTDSATCTIRWQRNPQTPAGLSASFKQAVCHYLAYLLAKPLSGNDSLKAEEYQLYLYWIDKAATDDRSWLSDNGEAWWTEEIG